MKAVGLHEVFQYQSLNVLYIMRTALISTIQSTQKKECVSKQIYRFKQKREFFKTAGLGWPNLANILRKKPGTTVVINSRLW